MGLLDTEVAKWKRSFGLLGGIPKTFKNNPRNAETMDAVFGFGGIIPGVGDAVSAAEAKYRYDQGDMLGAGLAGLGALPMVPALAGTFIGKGTKAANTGKAGQRFTDLLSPDYKLIDQAKRGGLLDVYPTPDRFVGAVRPGDTWAGFPARAYMEQRLVDKQVSTAAAPAQYAAGTGQSFRAQQDIPSYINDRPRNHLGQEIPPTPYELAHAEAQRVAALPVEQGGLGLPANNTAMDRARAMGSKPVLRIDATERAYKLGQADRAANGGRKPGMDWYYGQSSDELGKREWVWTTNQLNAAYEAGARGDDMPIVTTGYRYGNAPESGRSYNYADNVHEKGLSMAGVDAPLDHDWEKTISALFVKGDRPKKAFQGWHDPDIRGSDGEPLLLNPMPINQEDRNFVQVLNELGNGKKRSRFAAFNPAKRDSADLLAGLAPWAMPVGATLLGGSFLLPPEEY